MWSMSQRTETGSPKGWCDAATGQFQLLKPWGGTTASEFCPADPAVYGLFTATPSFITSNFDYQSVGTAAPAPVVAAAAQTGPMGSVAPETSKPSGATAEWAAIEAAVATRLHPRP
jgi:hypothetical protein